MRKLSFIIIFFFLSILIIPLININGSSHFFYREILFKKISDDLKSDNSRETFLNIFKYVYFNMDGINEGVNMPLVDENAYVDLVRGYGFCDQQSFVFMNLVNKVGFNSRLRDVQAHTFSEISIDDNWIIADPYFGLIFYNDNDLINIKDFNFYSKEVFSDYFGFLDIDHQKFNIDFFKQIYVKNETRWSEGIGPVFEKYRSYNYLRKILEIYGVILYNLFGNIYFNPYQDLYLKIYNTTSIINSSDLWVNQNLFKKNQIDRNIDYFKTFFIARNYHLSNRKLKALKYYKDSQLTFPNSYWSQESMYYMSKIYYELNNYEASINLLDKIDISYPRYSLVNYYKGLNYLKLKDNKKSKYYLNLSQNIHSKVILKELN